MPKYKFPIFQSIFSSFIFLNLVLPFSVFATQRAPQSVKGSVPVALPLQPAPANISPNYSGNIQSAGDISSPDEETLTTGENGNYKTEDALLTSTVTAPQFAPSGKYSSLWAVALIILLMVGAGFLIWRKRSKNI